MIKAYFINSKDKLEAQFEEMVKLAEVFNARVMINLNPRNYRKTGFHLLQKIADSMSNNDFSNLHRAYTSVCGEYHSELDRRWLVDIDDLGQLDSVSNFIEILHKINFNKHYCILAKIPSKNGVNLITNPFNIQRFSEKFPNIEIHKNNPTNLYVP